MNKEKQPIHYNMVIEGGSSTVVAEYTAEYKTAQKYQSEADLEAAFIKLLQNNGYEYIKIKTQDDLLKNLRVQLSKLNDYNFSDNEWKQILNTYLANQNERTKEKIRKIQEDFIYNLKCDNGNTKNIYIIDKKNIHNNFLQVINQYETEGNYKNIYDVTVLVNGLPLVHCELKRRGVSIREAFNQIDRYRRDSFWSESGLFEYAQLFVISNGTHTKYYSNTTRQTHIKERQIAGKTSDSFEFTSWWADAKNKRIADLMDFGKTFFSKHTLLAVLTKYCVFTTEERLLVMRPYQIAATEKILNKIELSTNYNALSKVDKLDKDNNILELGCGGYIWHTTGSGKTLTSFKTAQLASKLDYIDKVLFVVDRKDLDHQTTREYDKFEKGAANGNTSTEKLKKQLEDPNANIIITTIQKLDRFINKNKGHTVFNGHIVIIFDECHRSQFGNMHAEIIKSFKNYHIFGFTGTPIFAKNAGGGGNPHLKTTQQAFGEKLHSYTIVDAINDENVLPFRIDYVDTLKMKEGIKDKKVMAIDIKKAENAPERIRGVVEYILSHFNDKTKRNNFYQLKERRLLGFNSIFAVSSIETAKKYYAEFQKQMAELPEAQKLKTALIYSFGANEEEQEDGLLPDEDFDTSGLDKNSRDFLESAIKDYNKYFKTNYDASSDKFQNYYQDLSLKVKNREVDLLIVCNMFLTGFDAVTLNTLWVDKNLQQHGLLQAFSRTNRILNSVKAFGNIVCFRDLEQAANDAISLFGNKDACGIVLLKSYKEYYEGWENGGQHQRGYKELIAELTEKFPLPINIIGDQSEKEFIRLYGAILKVKNILTSFDDFADNEILSEREFQDYQSVYIDLYHKLRKSKDGDKENINDDIVFEMELVKQVELNIDYILILVAKYYKTNMQDKEILTTIEKAINSSLELRSKKELIENFINTINNETKVYEDWHKFAAENKIKDLEQIIKEENLKEQETKKFMDNAFRDAELKSAGQAFAAILPPSPMFSKDNARAKKKIAVLEKLRAFFDKYSGV
ncbi:MAG: type I restriction endonuclease subunit R [Endomicrobium sp.]|jgi:type I restriction enzyme R subunit|nr:type I restriction endonuclease subunit R [Endomicrobium sp.]